MKVYDFDGKYRFRDGHLWLSVVHSGVNSEVCLTGYGLSQLEMTLLRILRAVLK